MSGAARPPGPTTDQIADALRDRMLELCEAWGLAGTVRGNDFVCLNPFRDDRHAGSFRIAVRGSYQGLIKDFASGKTWSALDFTAKLWFGGEMAQAVRWAKGWLGLDGTDPDALQKTQAARENRAKREAEHAEKAEKTRRYAQYLYLQAQEDIADTPVDQYLYGRGIDIQRLPFCGRWFRGLRFHPALPCAEAQCKLPAMVAAITGHDGRFLSLHRTWLVQANGGWEKAPLVEPKLSLGLFGGQSGLVRLWRGVRIDPETGAITRLPAWRDMRAGSEVHICEGIEDAMSVCTQIIGARAVAGVSVSNMAAIAWPETVSTVYVWRQADPPGSDADVTIRQRLIPAYRAQGKRVVLPRMPEGVKDINDIVRAAARGEVAA